MNDARKAEYRERAETLAADVQSFYAKLPDGHPLKANAFQLSALVGEAVAHVRAIQPDSAPLVSPEERT